jgi:hypothetical protein
MINPMLPGPAEPLLVTAFRENCHEMYTGCCDAALYIVMLGTSKSFHSPVTTR